MHLLTLAKYFFNEFIFLLCFIFYVVENQIITGSIDRPDLVGSIDPPPRILNC